MKMLLNIREALRALRANALRSVLTMLGIIFGVAAVIVMVAIGAGTQQRIQQEIAQLGTNTLVINPGAALASGARLGSGTRPTLTIDDARAIEAEVRGLIAAAPLVRGRVHTVLGSANWATTAVGTTNAFFAAREWQALAGRFFVPDDLDMGRKVALLGATVAERLFPDGDAIDRTIRINHLSFVVIGVLEAKGQTMDGADLDDFVVMPVTTARNHLLGRSAGNARAVNAIVVKAEDGIELAAVEDELRQLLRQRHRLRADQEDGFRVHNMSAVLRVQEASSTALTMLLAAVASISLLVGGVGIMNIMLVSVTERTREIGVRAAIGAAPRDVLVQFLVEALALSLIGAAFGVLLGVGGAWLAETHFGMRTYLTLEPVALSSGFAAAVGIVFGFYPAWKAARLTPIDALRHE